jgi:hypothetical protein
MESCRNKPLETKLQNTTFDNTSTETRKGRHWEFAYHDAVASLSVVDTAKHYYDFVDDLLNNGLFIEDAPDAFTLNFELSRDSDREMCLTLAVQLADCFNGINCGLA